MKWNISYYDKTKQDILDWPKKILAKYIKTTDLIEEFGPNLGMPFTKPFGNGLFEIRAKGQEGIGRAFFCSVLNNEVVILHGFIKKTDQTPKQDLDIAKKRLREVKS
jgi:phage-related protein